MKPYEWFDGAAAEFHKALTISATRSPRMALELRQSVEQAILDLCSGLIVAARSAVHPCREFSLMRFPYSIIYVDAPDAIRIVAFPHHKRRQNYWRSRLDRFRELDEGENS